MAVNLSALVTTWGGLASGSTLKKLAAINAMTVTGPVSDISIDVVGNYLVNHNRITALLAFVNNTPSSPNAAALLACNYLVTILAGSDGPLLRAASEPSLMTILASLTADARTGITAGDLTALNSAVAPQIPWWQANGFSGPITTAELIAGGNLS